MSVESATQLVQKLKTDTALQQKLRGAAASGFRDAAKAAGYDATPEEFAQALEQHIRGGGANDVRFVADAGIVSGVVGGVTSGPVSGAVSGIV